MTTCGRSNQCLSSILLSSLYYSIYNVLFNISIKEGREVWSLFDFEPHFIYILFAVHSWSFTTIELSWKYFKLNINSVHCPFLFLLLMHYNTREGDLHVLLRTIQQSSCYRSSKWNRTNWSWSSLQTRFHRTLVLVCKFNFSF